ncbi:MAG: uridine kinase [Chloroflexia bacterium]|nr:uridine kinase [Chloroflexia bacterium]
MIDSTSHRTQVLDRLARYIAAAAPTHPLRVGIDGRTAAGKTSIANELVAPLEQLGRTVIRVEIDEFHRPLGVRRGRKELPPWQQYYLDSYDYASVRNDVLVPLGPGGNRRYRRAIFDSVHDTAIDDPPLLAQPDAVVLVDGVFLFRPELDDLWDLRIVIDVDAEDSLRRGPRRDLAWMDSIAAAEAKYHSTYIPGEDHYDALVKPNLRADVVVDNRNLMEPRLNFRTDLPAEPQCEPVNGDTFPKP